MPRDCWWRLFLPGASCVLLSAACLLSFGNAWGAAALAVAAVGRVMPRASMRRAGYAVDDELVAVREGWWSRYWRFAEIDKLQALQLTRSPLDRRLRHRDAVAGHCRRMPWRPRCVSAFCRKPRPRVYQRLASAGAAAAALVSSASTSADSEAWGMRATTPAPGDIGSDDIQRGRYRHAVSTDARPTLIIPPRSPFPPDDDRACDTSAVRRCRWPQ